jgi:hypothetical protein
VPDIDYLEDEPAAGIAEIPADAEQPPSAAGEVEPPLQIGWDEKTVATFLQGTGAGVHMLIGQTEEDWLMTSKDLERIAPPLTRICNRWEPALRLAPVADPLLVAHGFALYGWRSALEMKRAQRDAEAEANADERPGYVTAEPAPAAATRAPSASDEVEIDEPEPYFS